MKKILIILILFIGFTSCSNEQLIKPDSSLVKTIGDSFKNNPDDWEIYYECVEFDGDGSLLKILNKKCNVMYRYRLFTYTNSNDIKSHDVRIQIIKFTQDSIKYKSDSTHLMGLWVDDKNDYEINYEYKLTDNDLNYLNQQYEIYLQPIFQKQKEEKKLQLKKMDAIIKAKEKVINDSLGIKILNTISNCL